MSLSAHYFSNVKLEIRPQSRISNGPLSKKLSPATGPRRPDINGANSLRRVTTVRASSGSNESAGNSNVNPSNNNNNNSNSNSCSSNGANYTNNSNGIEVHRDEGTRCQWLWHDYSGFVNGLDSQDPKFDNETVHSFCPSPSEVWGCYDNQLNTQTTSTPSSSAMSNGNGVNNGNNGIGGDMTLEETSDSSAMTTEKEFLSYAMKMPRPQFSGIDLMDSDNKYCNDMEEVYVLLFGVGEASTEGIYSLRSYCSESGLHKETIICFESFEDATRFSGLLEATMPHLSTVHTIKPTELVQFCNDSGYACRLELEGSTLTPPEFNVGVTDWERSMKLRQGHFEVLDSEPERNNEAAFGPTKQETIQEIRTDTSAEATISETINMEIEDVREMLERLLPKD